MTKKQSDAVKARVETVPAFAEATHKSIVPHGTPFPYAVIHGSDGVDTAERLAGANTTMNPRYTLWIVGESADQVEVLTDKVKAVFIDANGYGIPLAVDGEMCQSLWWSMPESIQVATDPQPTIAWSAVEIGWTADPI